MNKKKIGIIGLGTMGNGMAENFLKNNFQVVVWNRNVAKMDRLVSLGAIKAASPKELASMVDVLFEVTANDESSKAVWLGEEGILVGAKDTTILVTSATLSIEWIDILSQLCVERSFIFLDAPLTGGRVAAEMGNLTMLFGGDEKIVDSLRSDLQAISGKILYFGSAGNGMRYKLILNFLQAVHIIGFGQAMKMAKKANMSLEKVAEGLVDRPGGVITQIAKSAYFSEPDPVTFSIEWIMKDLGYAKEFAHDETLTLLNDVLKVYEKAVDSGFKSKDWASVNALDE